LLIAWLKNLIIAITIRIVRVMWIKVRPRTIIIEVITAIWIIITLETVTAVIAIRVTRSAGV